LANASADYHAAKVKYGRKWVELIQPDFAKIDAAPNTHSNQASGYQQVTE